MYKLFNRVSSKEREAPSPTSAPSTFEEKFKLFNRGSKVIQEREPSFHGGSAASPVEETKFRLFGRGSSKSAQEREPSFHSSPPTVVEEKFKLFGRGSSASRLANHDREPAAAQLGPINHVSEQKPAVTRTPASTSTTADEPEQPQMILLPCPTCFRTFRVESLDRHKAVCEKMATKKRKVFDSAKQRLDDLPEVVLPASPVRTPLSPTLKRPSTSPSVKKQPAWKENHLKLIRTVREARASDMSRCPYCERNFNNKAYDRHVEWCKEQQSRIPKSPTHDNNEAKERWEARTRYRAPPLRRSIRSKYSPTRSLFSGANSPAPSVVDCSKSLSGSRASLDSRASSSAVSTAMSYQPSTSYGSGGGGAAKNGRGETSSAYYGSHTLGRATGSAFVRHSHDRRSLRAAPASPTPTRRTPATVETPVPLTPINNNRTSALRASLRMKNAFANLNNPYQSAHQPATKTPIVSRYAQQNLTTPSSSSSSVQQKRPSVLQLFSSAFNRPNASVPSSPQPPNRNHNARTVQAPIAYTNQGRRSEPEGVESKLMTASCYGNYTASPTATVSPTTTANTASKLKPPTRSAPILGKLRVKSLVAGTSLLPNKVCPMSNNNNNIRSRSRTANNHHYLKRYSSSDGYNPYLSAEKQLAELFDDDYAPKEKNRFSFSPKDYRPPPPESPKTPTPPPSSKQDSDNTNMEQLERDLKSILSEINQLGKDKDAVTSSTPNSTTPTAKASPLRLQPMPPPPANKVSTLSFTMSVPRTPSTPRTPSSPMSPTGSTTKASTPDSEERHLPKFCHSCGSAYPDRFEVKFCCQCGARRLYI